MDVRRFPRSAVSALADESGLPRAEVRALLAEARERATRLDGALTPPSHPALRTHLSSVILPAAGVYVTLREKLADREEALRLALVAMATLWPMRRRMLRVLRQMPARFAIFRLANRRTLAASFPPEGWQTEIVEDSPACFAYTMHTCFYWRTYLDLGLPELGPLSCRLDEIDYAGLPAEITFERTQTLATGGTCCDFVHRNLAAPSATRGAA